MNSTRQQKIASLLQRELANIFLQDSKSIYGCMITVTKATITPDLSIGRAYLSIYMAADKDAVIGAVRANTKDIHAGWDGGNLPRGMYVWVVRYKSAREEEHTVKGSVMVGR